MMTHIKLATGIKNVIVELDAESNDVMNVAPDGNGGFIKAVCLLGTIRNGEAFVARFHELVLFRDVDSFSKEFGVGATIVNAAIAEAKRKYDKQSLFDKLMTCGFAAACDVQKEINWEVHMRNNEIIRYMIRQQKWDEAWAKNVYNNGSSGKEEADI